MTFRLGEPGSKIITSDTHCSQPNSVIHCGYISKERLPVLPEREVLVPPDFAVEVKSPTDTRRALRRKAEKYLESGTRLIWLVFPESRTVEVYVPDKDDVPTGMDEILDGGEVLPGFHLAVKDIFPD